MTHTRKAQIDSLLPTAPSVKVDTCGIRTADPCPLARTLPPLGRWSGSFSHGVSFLGRETKDQPFNSYRCHPRGVFTGPYLLRRPYHPQKPGSQTLGLQCAPPTPPIGKSKESVPNEYSNLRRKINKMLQVCMIKDVWKDINLIGRG